MAFGNAKTVRTTSERVARRQERTRTEILDAAWQVAADHGIAGLSLREVAARVGLRTPSLYSYFASKHDLYDAMFAAGNRALISHFEALDQPADTHERARAYLRGFVDFCVADPARYQLLFQRAIPGFEPSPESYALAEQAYELAVRAPLAEIGVTDQAAVDLATAVGAGLAAQQLANDPGGDRWTRLVDRAADLILDHAPRRTP
ncbi:TetR family transcriptional regulator [Nostocoides sp. F2B08]|uniref:TetR/AcrR family transcriptional regulator n=1 Tax=Nostocoides sp. F2B08 TaxID=2653936 RepID=UPI001262E218|nr:TetR/AcrR family transcriptional regulator [Tetrasphaera sp. F2B08]KAB7744111.1 TetR family transcriptional regulator [Tetrasphaera sp. F2B08]